MKKIKMEFVVPEDFKVEDENEIRDMMKTLLRALVEDRGNYLLCRNGDDELVACLFAMRSKDRLQDIDLLADYLSEAKSFLDVM